MHTTPRVLVRRTVSFAALAAVAVLPALTTAEAPSSAAAASASGAAPAVAVDAAAAAPAAGARHGSARRCAAAVPAGTHQVDVELDGQAYPVRVHVPEDVDRRRPLPTVLNLHFSNGNAELVSQLSGLDDVADDRGFITVAPEAVIPAADPNTDGTWLWNVPGVPTTAGEYPPADSRDDVAFLSAVIDTFVGLGCTDRHRVYLTGHSGGARMASAYACAHPEKVAAIAPNAGLRAGRPSPDDPSAVELQSCAPRREVPVITFHGDADTVNPYEGNDDKRWGYTTQLAVQSWARINGCTVGPEVSRVTEHVTREAYSGCRRGADVELYRVSGGGHTWPGSPLDPSATQEVAASELMADFFAEHRR